MHHLMPIRGGTKHALWLHAERRWQVFAWAATFLTDTPIYVAFPCQKGLPGANESGALKRVLQDLHQMYRP